MFSFAIAFVVFLPTIEFNCTLLLSFCIPEIPFISFNILIPSFEYNLTLISIVAFKLTFLPFKTSHSIFFRTILASISACDILLSISINSEKSILLLSPLISSSPLSTRYIMLLSIVPSTFTLPFIISFLYMQTFPLKSIGFTISGLISGTIIELSKVISFFFPSISLLTHKLSCKTSILIFYLLFFFIFI